MFHLTSIVSKIVLTEAEPGASCDIQVHATTRVIGGNKKDIGRNKKDIGRNKKDIGRNKNEREREREKMMDLGIKEIHTVKFIDDNR